MTSKAKYIGRYVDKYDRDDVDLEYEYKGKIYYVHIHNTEGNKPLAWQHKREQARIDKELELREKDRIDKELELREKDSRKKEDCECIETVDDNIKYYLLDMIGI